MTIAEVEKLMEVIKTGNPLKIIEYVETLLEVANDVGVTFGVKAHLTNVKVRQRG